MKRFKKAVLSVICAAGMVFSSIPMMPVETVLAGDTSPGSFGYGGNNHNTYACVPEIVEGVVGGYYAITSPEMVPEGITIDSSSGDITVNSTVTSPQDLTVTYIPGNTDTYATVTADVRVQYITVATPTISPNGGTFTSAQTVTISCDTAGATIYYTTNGNNPDAISSVYSSPITISSTTTIKAFAILDATDTEVVSATFTIVDPTTYTITKEGADTPKGSFTVTVGGVAATSSKEGDTVTIATTPDSGYGVGFIEVWDSDGKPVAISGSDNSYTYAAPASDVTVSVFFVKDEVGGVTEVSDGDEFAAALKAGRRNIKVVSNTKINGGTTTIPSDTTITVNGDTQFSANLELVNNGTIVVNGYMEVEGGDNNSYNGNGKVSGTGMINCWVTNSEFTVAAGATELKVNGLAVGKANEDTKCYPAQVYLRNLDAKGDDSSVEAGWNWTYGLSVPVGNQAYFIFDPEFNETLDNGGILQIDSATGYAVLPSSISLTGYTFAGWIDTESPDTTSIVRDLTVTLDGQGFGGYTATWTAQSSGGGSTGGSTDSGSTTPEPKPEEKPETPTVDPTSDITGDKTVDPNTVQESTDANGNKVTEATNTDGSTTKIVDGTDESGVGTKTTTVTETDGTVKEQTTTKTEEGTVTESASEKKENGDFVESTKVTNADGTTEESSASKVTDEATGTVNETETTKAADDSTTEWNKETKTNDDFKETFVAKDAEGNVTEQRSASRETADDGTVTEKSASSDANGSKESEKVTKGDGTGDFTETAVTKDASGNVTETKEASQETDAATGDVTAKEKTVDANGTTEPEKVTTGDGTGDFEARETVTAADGVTVLKETTESKSTDENQTVTEQKKVVEGTSTTEEKSVTAQDGSGSVAKTVEDETGKTSNEVTKGENGVATAIRQEDAPANGEPVVANYAVNGDSVSLSNVETTASEVAVADTIPAADGKTYGVTEVGKGAFTGNTNLTAAAFGAGIRKLAKQAMSGCKKLVALIFGVSDLKMNRTSVKGLSGKADKIVLGKNSLKGTSKKLIIGVENKADKKAVKKQLKKAGNKHAKVKIGYRLR